MVDILPCMIYQYMYYQTLHDVHNIILVLTLKLRFNLAFHPTLRKWQLWGREEVIQYISVQ